MTVDPSYAEALRETLSALSPMAAVQVDVGASAGLVLAEELFASVDSPSAPSSSRDGYALRSEDLPGPLRVVGRIVAGGAALGPLRAGEAAEILTGGVLPEGADAVVPEERAERTGDRVSVRGSLTAGSFVNVQGRDVAAGVRLAGPGQVIRPALAGLLAAAGVSALAAHPRPVVGVLATGDEVVAPGRPLRAGQLYSSNLVTLAAWLRGFGMEVHTALVGDRPGGIRVASEALLDDADALITSGGAWKSARDQTIEVLKSCGELVFQRVRMTPGKAAALVMVGGKPAFCLPGGPPSNEMAFLQLALPDLLRLAGRAPTPLPVRRARLARALDSDPGWTHFVQAELVERDGLQWATPLRDRSRLRAQAHADGLIVVDEDVTHLPAGAEAQVQLLPSG